MVTSFFFLSKTKFELWLCFHRVLFYSGKLWSAIISMDATGFYCFFLLHFETKKKTNPMKQRTTQKVSAYLCLLYRVLPCFLSCLILTVSWWLFLQRSNGNLDIPGLITAVSHQAPPDLLLARLTKKKLGKNSVHHRGPISVRWLSPTSITLPVRIGQKMKLNDDCRFSTFTDKRKDAITQKSCDFPHLIV